MILGNRQCLGRSVSVAVDSVACYVISPVVFGLNLMIEYVAMVIGKWFEEANSALLGIVKLAKGTVFQPVANIKIWMSPWALGDTCWLKWSRRTFVTINDWCHPLDVIENGMAWMAWMAWMADESINQSQIRSTNWLIDRNSPQLMTDPGRRAPTPRRGSPCSCSTYVGTNRRELRIP